jgi:hypothetical protein
MRMHRKAGSNQLTFVVDNECDEHGHVEKDDHDDYDYTLMMAMSTDDV